MGEIWYSEKREADEPQYTVFRERPRLRLRPAADLIWLLLYHFPHQQISLGQKHEYFSSDKKQKIIPPSPQSVIVNLLIFISFRFLSFNDVGDHLLKKIMFAPPYGDVQVVSLQFDVKWVSEYFLKNIWTSPNENISHQLDYDHNCPVCPVQWTSAHEYQLQFNSHQS